MKIAIQGEPGSFSYEAAGKFVPSAEIVPCQLSADVFAALTSGKVDAAAIPIENSLAGSVLEHFDLLLAHSVSIVRETLLRIRHNFIVLPNTNLENIQCVYSHPVALAQCRQFLAYHPQIRSLAFYDTAGSVKHLMEQRDETIAAIASQAAAQYYGATILERDIEDNAENFTRFFLVHRTGEVDPHPQSNKISIAFALENRPGSLVAALKELAAIGTNLTKIESRPVQGRPWEYIFYVDCQIHSAQDASCALDALRPHCSMLKELGRYCAADRE